MIVVELAILCSMASIGVSILPFTTPWRDASYPRTRSEVEEEEEDGGSQFRAYVDASPFAEWQRQVL